MVDITVMQELVFEFVLLQEFSERQFLNKKLILQELVVKFITWKYYSQLRFKGYINLGRLSISVHFRHTSTNTNTTINKK